MINRKSSYQPVEFECLESNRMKYLQHTHYDKHRGPTDFSKTCDRIKKTVEKYRI